MDEEKEALRAEAKSHAQARKEAELRNERMTEETLLCGKITEDTAEQFAQAQRHEEMMVLETLEWAQYKQVQEENRVRLCAETEVKQMRTVLAQQELAASVDRQEFAARSADEQRTMREEATAYAAQQSEFEAAAHASTVATLALGNEYLQREVQKLREEAAASAKEAEQKEH